jgi:regulator of sirC expression with transglutaminase-like and TPR domain
MDVTERFSDAVSAPSDLVRLDIAALCIAASAHPGLDIEAECRRLDALAASCPDVTFDALRHHLFSSEGFRGNTVNYSDPENSFLDSVLARRLGIPITLSVVTMEVGRRLGLDVRGVGLPGHFLVKESTADSTWCDPFHGGRLIGVDGCQRLFARVHGDTRGFHPAYLAPTSPHAILARMLNNLEQGPLATEPHHLEWMCALHLTIPDLGDAERTRLETLLRSVKARWN